MTTDQSRILVLYHYPCPDGGFAALAAALHFQQIGQERVLFVPNRVYDPCTVSKLDLQASDTVYLLDYVGPAGFGRQLAALVSRVIVIDHHKTAYEEYSAMLDKPGNMDITFDMEHSAALLALQHFEPQVSADLKAMFEMIEDGDLWLWRIPGSREFYAGLRALKLDYDASSSQDIFTQLQQLKSADVIKQGAALMQQEAMLVAEALRNAFPVEISLPASNASAQKGTKETSTHRALAARADHMPDLRSQLGNELAQASKARGWPALGLVVYREAGMQGREMIKCSLRSLGSEDTTRISKAFQGGGHLNASSFLVETSVFESWVVESGD